jgi:cytochrome c-type biogenesis protein CcmH/NrfF
MKIGKTDVRISAVHLAVVGIFTIFLLLYAVISGDWGTLLWAIPTLVLLLVIPMALNYMSQNQYRELIPLYEKEAKKVGIKAINTGMLGEPVRVEGVVEKVRFKFLNRPQYIVADKSGEISVKMFTNPREDIKEGDVVEVLGLIIKRYILTGDAIINCVEIRRIDKGKKS